MHWEHPIPFLFNVPHDRDFTRLLGRSSDEEHPGEPPRRPFTQSPTLPFDYTSRASYDTRMAGFTPPDKIEDIVNVSRQIYNLNPVSKFSGREASSSSNAHMYVESRKHGTWCKDRSVAVIARALLGTGQFVNVVPVRLNAFPVGVDAAVSRYYALFITFESGVNTLLPLNIWFLGSEKTGTWKSQNDNTKQWTYGCPGLEDLTAKFDNTPIVRCEDVRLFRK
jgi:hypothetical protein